MPSEIAHLIMFGYEREDYPGRGYLEALGSGIPVGNGDISLLAHLASIHEENDIFHLAESRPVTNEEECRELFAFLSAYRETEDDISFVQTSLHDGVLVVRGHASRHVTDSDPLIPGSPLITVRALETHRHDPSAEKTAHRISRFIRWSHEQLGGHEINRSRINRGQKPLNGVITQRAGAPMAIPPFENRWGMKGLIIASGRVYRGIAAYTGMDFIHHPDTGSPGDDLADRIALAGKEFKDHDFIHVHTKMPDEAAHRKDPVYKKKVLEMLDRGIARETGELLEDPDTIVIVTADHSTPSSGRLIHSGEPVPIMIHGRNLRRDMVRQFDEISVASGALGCMRGREFMLTVLNCMDRARLPGFADDPSVPVYWPAIYEPFRKGD